jgi:hypothetical protein
MASLSPDERQAVTAAVGNLTRNLASPEAYAPSLRQMLLVSAALQLSGGGLSEASLLSAISKEFSLAAAPLIRAQSPSRAALCAAYLAVARALALVALLDGRPYDALVALHTADRALGATGGLSPASGSLQARATPSDGLLAGLCSDAPLRGASGGGGGGGARRGGSAISSSSAALAPASFTSLEHALVASAVLLHALPGRGAEVGGRPSAVGRSGGLNLRRGALDVLAQVKRSGSEGGSVVVAGERLARLAAATPLSSATGELSPRVWELVGHASCAVSDLSAARVCYGMGGLEALPALAAACLLSSRVEEALALGARCARVLDGLYSTGSSTGSSASSSGGGGGGGGDTPQAAALNGEEEEAAAHAASLPYRLTCWVLGTAMGSFFSPAPFSFLAAQQGGDAAAAASAWPPAIAAALAACGDGQPMCGGCDSGSAFLPHPLALASALLPAEAPATPLASRALLRSLLAPWNAASPAAGAWVPTPAAPLAAAVHSCSAANAWSPASALTFLLRAAGCSSSGSGSGSSSGSPSSPFSLCLPEHRGTVVSRDAFAVHALLLAAHVAVQARPRETQVLTALGAGGGGSGARALRVFSSGLEGAVVGGDPSNPRPPPAPRQQQQQRGRGSEPILGYTCRDFTVAAPSVTRALVRFFMATASATASASGSASASASLLASSLLHALARGAVHVFEGAGGSAARSTAATARATLSTLLACATEHLPAPALPVFFHATLQAAGALLGRADAALCFVGVREGGLEGECVAAVTAGAAATAPLQQEALLPQLAPNPWVPGRYKVLWALTAGAAAEEAAGLGAVSSSSGSYSRASSGSNNSSSSTSWQENPPPPLLKALRGLPPSSLSPNPLAAPLYESPELLRASLLRACIDYPLLIRAMVGGASSSSGSDSGSSAGVLGLCGHAETRSLLCRLRRSVDRGVDATLRLSAHFAGGQAVEVVAGRMSPSQSQSQQQQSQQQQQHLGAGGGHVEYDALVDGVIVAVGMQLDVIAAAGDALVASDAASHVLWKQVSAVLLGLLLLLLLLQRLPLPLLLLPPHTFSPLPLPRCTACCACGGHTFRTRPPPRCWRPCFPPRSSSSSSSPPPPPAPRAAAAPPSPPAVPPLLLLLVLVLVLPLLLAPCPPSPAPAPPPSTFPSSPLQPVPRQPAPLRAPWPWAPACGWGAGAPWRSLRSPTTPTPCSLRPTRASWQAFLQAALQRTLPWRRAHWQRCWWGRWKAPWWTSLRVPCSPARAATLQGRAPSALQTPCPSCPLCLQQSTGCTA